MNLMARIRTALRHTYNAIGITDYVHKELSISFEKHLTFLNGKPLHLTQIQYKILSFLAENHGKVVTYNTLMEHVWGPYVDDNNRILRVNMAHIRRKIEPNPSEPIHVITEVGIGYRMAESE